MNRVAHIVEIDVKCSEFADAIIKHLCSYDCAAYRQSQAMAGLCCF
jgi:hypothetical protein